MDSVAAQRVPTCLQGMEVTVPCPNLQVNLVYVPQTRPLHNFRSLMHGIGASGFPQSWWRTPLWRLFDRLRLERVVTMQQLLQWKDEKKARGGGIFFMTAFRPEVYVLLCIKYGEQHPMVLGDDIHVCGMTHTPAHQGKATWFFHCLFFHCTAPYHTPLDEA